ncbi:MAG: hypothetical protein ABJB11_20765 [Ferruginibacter sp.]
MNKRFTIKSILLATLWISIAAGTVVLLVSAIQKKDKQHCKGVHINIEGVTNNFFVDKKDIQASIRSISDGNPVGKAIGSFKLKAIEQELQRNIWVKNVQLFFDNNEILQVAVLEREPVARIFTNNGATFYIDSSLTILPLSDKFSARLPVFTNFPTDKKVLIKADSALLKDILLVSNTIQGNSFLMAMIDQVDITPQRTFEMVPKFGNNIIVFGDANDVIEKFKKLELFYKEVIVKAGWNKYSVIDIQYKNQVVAKRKGAEEVKADSMHTLQLMKSIAENAERMASDSTQMILQDNEHNTTNSNLIQQSIERDDNNTLPNTSEKPQPQGAATEKSTSPAAPVVSSKPAITTTKQTVLAPVKKVEIKPAQNTTPADVKKPKLVMPKPLPKKTNNDY